MPAACTDSSARPSVRAPAALRAGSTPETYLFSGVVTSTAAGIFIIDLVRKVGLWPESPFQSDSGVADSVAAPISGSLSGGRGCVVQPGRRRRLRAPNVTTWRGIGRNRAMPLHPIDSHAVAITLVKLIAGDSHGGPRFDMSVFTVAPAIDSAAARRAGAKLTQAQGLTASSDLR